MRKLCKTVLCIFALFVILSFSGCGSTEYSVRDFANVTVIGYTEHGSLSIKVDDAAINKIYADGKRDKTAALRFAETFRFSYEGQNDEDSYFTNGDVVTINVTYDEGMAKALGVAFIDNSFEYTIEGLEDKLQLSPFDGLSVKFSGVAPYGSVQLDKSNCIQYVIDNVTFNCDQYDLSNGDKVVVKAEYNSEIAERNGYVFTEDVKKFTVVGLSKYVTSMLDVSYSPITARMRYMVEEYVEGTETSYKSLDWFFGEEESDTDSDGYIDEDETEIASEDSEELSDEEDEEYIAEEVPFEDEETDEEQGEPAEDEDGDTSSKQKKKRKTDVQRIKDDFVLSNFRASFEYFPVCCFYSLNPLQYSDNIFYSVYRIKGTFVCEDTSGTGYIKPGDTVVGEIYVTASLTGGSVDIKNNLVYEENVLDNIHSYSAKSYPTYEDMSSEVFKSTTYVVETLEYYEDEEAYDKFVSEQMNGKKHNNSEVSHITIDSDYDTEKNSRSSSSEKESSDSDTSSALPFDTDAESGYYDPEEGENEGGFEEENEDEGYVEDYDGGFVFEYDYDE